MGYKELEKMQSYLMWRRFSRSGDFRCICIGLLLTVAGIIYYVKLGYHKYDAMQAFELDTLNLQYIALTFILFVTSLSTCIGLFSVFYIVYHYKRAIKCYGLPVCDVGLHENGLIVNEVCIPYADVRIKGLSLYHNKEYIMTCDFKHIGDIHSIKRKKKRVNRKE